MVFTVRRSIKRSFDIFAILLLVLSIVFVYFITDKVLVSNKNTISLVFSSLPFWLFFICYVISVLGIRYFISRKTSHYLKPFQQLEQWANLSTSKDEAFILATPLQNNKDNISQAILILLEQLQKNQNNDNQYTQKIRENVRTANSYLCFVM